jgi:hypothetical protein
MQISPDSVFDGLARPADLDAAVQVLLAIGQLIQTIPKLTEIDVNPLMVHAKGPGAITLDALIITPECN